ncbi:MAG: YkvA family protein [Lutisporaceae bacterium]
MKNIKYFFGYIRDKEVPIYKKAMIFGSLLYFILPIDIVPDYIFALGWLDDAAVAAFIWNVLRTEISEYITKQKITDSKVINFEEKRNKTNK